MDALFGGLFFKVGFENLFRFTGHTYICGRFGREFLLPVVPDLLRLAIAIRNLVELVLLAVADIGRVPAADTRLLCRLDGTAFLLDPPLPPRERSEAEILALCAADSAFLAIVVLQSSNPVYRTATVTVYWRHLTRAIGVLLGVLLPGQ